jgi:hypothetical protein
VSRALVKVRGERRLRSQVRKLEKMLECKDCPPFPLIKSRQAVDEEFSFRAAV